MVGKPVDERPLILFNECIAQFNPNKVISETNEDFTVFVIDPMIPNRFIPMHSVYA